MRLVLDDLLNTSSLLDKPLRIALRAIPKLKHKDTIALCLLHPDRKCRQQDVVTQTKLHKVEVSRSFGNLEQQRLIKRCPDEVDWRSQTYSLTEEGARVRAEALGIMADYNRKNLLYILTGPETDTLNAFARRIEAAALSNLPHLASRKTGRVERRRPWRLRV
jgi:DNA-binding MarR family transcriptional regulator